MIPLEGRMIPGLDEFMLRIGHLKVLCSAAREAGSSWFRIRRETAAVLTRPTPVPETVKANVAEYLKRKRLSQVVRSGEREAAAGDRLGYRYPDIFVECSETGIPRIRRSAGVEKPIELWWQDVCLASPRIKSRVGAVTASAKSGSKTGLSHICDWAEFLGLIGKAGEISPIGRLIVDLSHSKDRGSDVNPYVIGWERLAFAYVSLSADIDLFSRFARKLYEAESPIRKAQGTELFVNVVSALAQEARDARYLSAGRKQRIFENMRDLESASKHGKHAITSTSTAWHRVSSRLETYTDLNLLEKGRKDEAELYEYVYYPSPSLARAVRTLESSRDATDWIETHLTSVILDADCSCETLPQDIVLRSLPPIISAIGRPSGPQPIEALAVGLACAQAGSGNVVSLGACRGSLESLAHQRPDIGRLSRGGSGDRAEYISFDLRKLEEASS